LYFVRPTVMKEVVGVFIAFFVRPLHQHMGYVAAPTVSRGAQKQCHTSLHVAHGRTGGTSQNGKLGSELSGWRLASL
jgi:hypothetical protein